MQVFGLAISSPFERYEFIPQLDEVGSKSLPLVSLASAAIGAVLAMQARYSLVRFGAKTLLTSANVFAVMTEMSPIVISLTSACAGVQESALSWPP